jgi:site-specific recombinase XerD
MKISFWLAGSKLNRAGLAPIFAKIHIRGKKKVQLSTGISVPPDRWLPGGYGFIKGDDKLAASYNEQLLNIRADLQAIYNDLERLGRPVSPKIIKDIFTGAQAVQVRLISAMLHLVEAKKKEGKTKSYTDTLLVRVRAVSRFLNDTGRKDMQLSEISIPFMAAVEDHFLQDRNFDQSTTNKILNILKNTAEYGVRREWIDYNPISAYRNRKLEKKPKVYLTAAEVGKIRSHKFASHRLQRIAWLFLLQCYTGLAYVDLMRLDKNWIKQGVDAKLWIYLDRQKVAGSECRIPLFQPALECLEYLQWKIDRIANGNYNAYLKEIAVIVGIDKNLTTHVARKTFGNLLLDQGVSLEVVSSMYGHSTTKTTLSYYVDISEKRIAEEVSKIKL